MTFNPDRPVSLTLPLRMWDRVAQLLAQAALAFAGDKKWSKAGNADEVHKEFLGELNRAYQQVVDNDSNGPKIVREVTRHE